MTNTINNVPRELLADLLGNDHDKRIMAERHLLAMLANAPSPAGVDGLEVKRLSIAGVRSLIECSDGELARYSDVERLLAIIDGLRGEVAELEAKTSTAMGVGSGSGNLFVYGDHDSIKAAQKIVIERDQQAQRIGELEGLLREVAASLAWNAHGECRAIHDGPIMPSQMAIDAVKVALGGSL